MRCGVNGFGLGPLASASWSQLLPKASGIGREMGCRELWMIRARRLSEEVQPLFLKHWQEPVPFGMHRSIQEGKDGLKCCWLAPVRLPAIWNSHQAAGGVMDMA